MRNCFVPAALAVLCCTSLLRAEAPQPEPFGKTKDGTPVEIYTLKNEHGMTVRIMTRGATIVNLMVPDKDGNIEDVVMGFDDVAGYESDANQYFGTTVGRVANRIAKGKFTINGKEYQVPVNDGTNALHGGTEKSLDKVVWEANSFENGQAVGLVCRYTSADGEEGYPGTLKCAVRFALAKKANKLRIDYSATTDQDTPVNITNHSYFNLSGEGSETVLDHVLQLFCDKYTPTDDTLIPTGEIKSVEGTPLDFREPHVVGERITVLDDTAAIGYDHNMVINGKPGTIRPAAILTDPESGRVMELSTDEPGVQFYSGNFMHGQAGKGGKEYPHRSAICLETQHYPDSVNHPDFPSTILHPGEEYKHTAIFEFSTTED